VGSRTNEATEAIVVRARGDAGQAYRRCAGAISVEILARAGSQQLSSAANGWRFRVPPALLA